MPLNVLVRCHPQVWPRWLRSCGVKCNGRTKPQQGSFWRSFLNGRPVATPGLYFRRCWKRHIFATELLCGHDIHQAGVRSPVPPHTRRRAGRADKARRPSRRTGWAPRTFLPLSRSSPSAPFDSCICQRAVSAITVR